MPAVEAFSGTVLAGSRFTLCMHVQVLAFRFTANTSVQLLNSFTIPFVFVMCAPEPYLTLLSYPFRCPMVSFSISWGRIDHVACSTAVGRLQNTTFLQPSQSVH